MNMTVSDEPPLRDVVIGRNSKVWQSLCSDRQFATRFPLAIGHREVAGFAFASGDRVWVFAYSKNVEENRALLDRLSQVPGLQVVYVSSASAIAASATRCYAYPTAKHEAEVYARQRVDARILVLGLVVDRLDELPGGTNIATQMARIADFMREPQWPLEGGRRAQLFDVVHRPFESRVEHLAYLGYGVLFRLAAPWPCALRPVDALLRVLGMRWYGYLYLSNRLWTSTTS